MNIEESAKSISNSKAFNLISTVRATLSASHMRRVKNRRDASRDQWYQKRQEASDLLRETNPPNTGSIPRSYHSQHWKLSSKMLSREPIKEVNHYKATQSDTDLTNDSMMWRQGMYASAGLTTASVALGLYEAASWAGLFAAYSGFCLGETNWKRLQETTENRQEAKKLDEKLTTYQSILARNS